MDSEEWCDGLLYDDQGEFLLARISYRLCQGEGLDGFCPPVGRFVVREEACPLHTGAVQLMAPGGECFLARVARISRPAGDGDLEIIQRLEAAGDRVETH